MLNKCYLLLSSKECEYFSITFLVHCISLFVLSIIFSVVEKPSYSKIILSSIQESQVEETTIEILDIKIDETSPSSLRDSIINQEVKSDSSPKIEEPQEPSLSIVDNDSISEIFLDTNNKIIGESISGIGSDYGLGIFSAQSTGGALDRLTLEIMNNAEFKDLLVIWVLDASVSLSKQRDTIAQRFESILKELELNSSSHEISHTICSFGKDINFITQIPNKNPTNLVKDILSIQIDASGMENTFGAIYTSCQKYYNASHKSMVIVFTDEVGDDVHILDNANKYARYKQIPIYCVGSPAPFGKNKTEFRFIDCDPQYDNSERWVEIIQGPETLEKLVLDIKSLPIDDEVLDSGFGPFALSKLCHDTGGYFISIHPNRSNEIIKKTKIDPLSSYISKFFDTEIMSKYKPDYRSINTQLIENQTHKTKKCLIDACKIQLEISSEQTLVFKADNEGLFVEELNKAQRFSAKIEPKINHIYQILTEGEKAAKTLKDHRWIASYYLAMGRILATKYRIELYNLVLAEAKSGLKKHDNKSNVWILKHTDKVTINNSSIKKSYESARYYLQYILDHYPETPWSYIASAELNATMGYTWIEHYEQPAPNRPLVNTDPKPENSTKTKLIPKPKRKIDKI